MIVEVDCEMLVGAVGVVSGLPGAPVAVAFGMPVLEEEQLINTSAISRQAQIVEKRDDGLTIREEQCWKIIGCSFFF